MSEKGKDIEVKRIIPQRLWNIKECASFLASTPNAVYMRVAKNAIPYVKLGKSLRFNPDEIMAMVESSTIRPITTGGNV